MKGLILLVILAGACYLAYKGSLAMLQENNIAVPKVSVDVR